MHPLDSQWIGHVSTGQFKAEDGVEHTFDRFENVFPKLGAWRDVQSASCVGAPCAKPQKQAVAIAMRKSGKQRTKKRDPRDVKFF